MHVGRVGAGGRRRRNDGDVGLPVRGGGTVGAGQGQEAAGDVQVTGPSQCPHNSFWGRYLALLEGFPHLFHPAGAVHFIPWGRIINITRRNPETVRQSSHRVSASLHPGLCAQVLKGHRDEVCALLKVSRTHGGHAAGGGLLVSGSRDAAVYLWDLRSNGRVGSLNGIR